MAQRPVITDAGTREKLRFICKTLFSPPIMSTTFDSGDMTYELAKVVDDYRRDCVSFALWLEIVPSLAPVADLPTVILWAANFYSVINAEPEALKSWKAANSSVFLEGGYANKLYTAMNAYEI